MYEWLSSTLEPYTGLLSVMMIGSLVVMVMSIALLPWIVSRIPKNYFARKRRTHKKSGWLIWLFRNIVGGVLIFAGILMLMLPGQGILTILAGLYVVDAQWKFRLERRLVGLPGILRSINWIRRRRNQPDLEI